jgi:hypothetical protein
MWRHGVFSEKQHARHSYHDLDKLTLRDFIRVRKEVFFTLGISTAGVFLVQNFLNKALIQPGTIKLFVHI